MKKFFNKKDWKMAEKLSKMLRIGESFENNLNFRLNFYFTTKKGNRDLHVHYFFSIKGAKEFIKKSLHYKNIYVELYDITNGDIVSEKNLLDCGEIIGAKDSCFIFTKGGILEHA